MRQYNLIQGLSILLLVALGACAQADGEWSNINYAQINCPEGSSAKGCGYTRSSMPGYGR